MTSHTAPDIIHKLVETFEQNLDSYRSTKNETELRREFLDKFFTALGWDVANEKAYDEAHKEVVHEFSVEVSGQQKKADYAFRVGSNFDFLVEAKKPSVKIESSQDAAFQIRRYGWSAKLPINILTDFEHFAVYDCRAKPNYNDKAATGRILLIHYTEYVERWDEIAAIFSPEAVRQGSFAKYAEGTKRKKGTADVDDAFLQEIERWRELLAKNIALRNEDIDIPGLNYAVQMTIDRIVFLRICEERGIEAENQLLDIANATPSAFGTSPKFDKSNSGSDSKAGVEFGVGREGVYKELCELFKRADTKYNSGLFHFKKEKEQASRADDLTLDLAIDDKVLKDIISNLYYPKSPYAFLYIPADILGQVYERFLGKVIRLTAGHQAKVEEKPEVRKAGGVYYTPTYIVDYIVKNTVGQIVNLSTPAQVAKLKIVDPACGSGTFLLGAYQFLLDWHLNWYVNDDAEKWEKNKAIYPHRPSGTSPKSDWGSSDLGEAGRGSYRLTTSKKKEILLNNIHGVDIDAQAVEVTKLSLLLKVLENASGQMGLGMERVLPDLGNNIKCGNSLIGWDYFEGQLFPDDEERARVNPFDWKSEFPQVFSTPSAFGTSPKFDKSNSGSDSKAGVEFGGGRVGVGFDAVIGNPPYRMMQPHNTELPTLDYLRKKYLVAEFKMEMFHMFLQLGVSILRPQGIHGFIIPATILNNVYAENLRKWIASNCAIQKISVADEKVFEDADVHTLVLVIQKEGDDKKRTDSRIQITTQLNKETAGVQGFYKETKQKYFESLEGSVWNILINDENADLILRLNKEYPNLSEVSTINRGLITGDRGKYFSDKKLSDEYVQILAGSDVSRYFTKEPSEYVLFKKPKGSGGSWDADMHLAPHKILVRQIGTKPMACLIREPIAVTGNLFTVRASSIEAELYILGIFNSKLIEFFWKVMFSDFKNSFPQVTIFSISQVSIRTINFANPAEKAQHDKMVSLVEAMLAAYKSLAAAHSPAEKERLERQIQVTDREIDSLVYALYGLTEEEIRIVEGE